MSTKQKNFSVNLGMLKNLPPSDIVILSTLSTFLFIFLFIVLYILSSFFLIETPIRYGSINYGVTGITINYNPLYSSSNIEKDLGSLVHASLLQYNNGSYRNQIAEKITRTGEFTYHVLIKENLTFHNGNTIGIKDILFTILMAQSDKKNNYHKQWKGVEVERVNSNILKFTISNNNTDFITALTIPILPYHIWRKVPKEKRERYAGPGYLVGAGPYQLENIEFTIDSKPIKINLKSFQNYVYGWPYIKNISLTFFENTTSLLNAYRNKKINGIYNISSLEIPALQEIKERESNIYTADTNRVFGIFYNQQEDRILNNQFLRSVLSVSASKEDITKRVFNEYATKLTYPLSTDIDLEVYETTIQGLKIALDDIGWKFDGTLGVRAKDNQQLKLSFVYQDIEEIKQVAALLERQWNEIGIQVTSRALKNDVFQTVLANGGFDIVLAGFMVKKIPDLIDIFSTNSKLSKIISSNTYSIDKLLLDLSKIEVPEKFKKDVEKIFLNYKKHETEDIQKIDNIWRNIIYKEFKMELINNVSTTILYSPKFIFILPNTINGVLEKNKDLRIRHSGDRFSEIHNWYVKKEKVWEFLYNYIEKTKKKENI